MSKLGQTVNNLSDRLSALSPVRLLAAALGCIVIAFTLLLFGMLFVHYHNQTVKSPKIATIIVSDKGFSPSTLTIDRGTVVEWRVNDESRSHIVASNPYPADTDVPGLKSSQLGKGTKYRYQFNKSGTYSYHDDLKPTQGGTVEVK